MQVSSSVGTARWRRRGAVAAACVLVGLVATPTAASAVDPDGGRWFYTAPGFPELHQRTTGEGITIAVLDGPLNPGAPDLAGADVVPHEPSYCADEPGGAARPATSTGEEARHMTSIATMLAGTDAGVDGQPGIPGIAPGATIRTYAIAFERGDEALPCHAPAGVDHWDVDGTALRDAVAEGADIVVVPGTHDFSDESIADALRAGVVVIGAGGNDGISVWGSPAERNGVIATGTIDENIELDAGSPHGRLLTVVAPGAHVRATGADWRSYGTTTGSSNSAAYVGGALALLWSLYPDASDAQIIQAMLHTTDGRVAETPVHDVDWGYGVASPRTMLTVDPTTYPDVHPLIRDDEYARPTRAEIEGVAPTPAASPTPEPGEARETPSAAGGSPAVPTALVGLGLGVLGIAAAGVAVGVTVSRLRRHP